jgi:hypothetical protein
LITTADAGVDVVIAATKQAAPALAKSLFRDIAPPSRRTERVVTKLQLLQSR